MKISSLLVLAFVLGGVSACGPVYHTDYAFRPPKSAEGRSCVFQCEQSRQQCRQIEDMQQDNCQNRSYWENARCEDDIRRRKGREPKWYECGTDSCSADYDRCDDSYRSCYQSCGGEVQTNTYCVSGCEKAVPKQSHK